MGNFIEPSESMKDAAVSEEERIKIISDGFVPNRYDLIKIIIFVIVMCGVFYIGYLMNDTNTCRVWFKEQLYEFDIQKNNSLTELYNNLTAFNVS